MTNVHPIMTHFLQPYMPAKLAHNQQNNEQTVVPKGDWLRYQYNHNHINNLVLDCILEYQPREKKTHWDPCVDESATLVYALMNGVDISEVLSEDVVGLIEEEAIGSVETSQFDADVDRGQDRYEFGREFA